MANPDPKFAKFSGEGKLKIEAFLAVFANAFSTKTDAEKVSKLASYLEGDAFNFYATDILSVPGITFATARDLFRNRFGHSELPPMRAAINRRLIRSETIKDYYDDKCQHLRRAHMPEDQISDVLTEGLPDAYRPHFYGKRFQTPGEWLRLALDIEADVSAKSQSQKHRPSTHCQATIKHCDEVSGSKPQQSSKQNRFQSKKKPPTPCKFCTDLGQTNYHWHRECKNRTQSTTPETTNVITADDNTDTPPVTNVSKSNINVPAVGNFITTPAKIGNWDLVATVDTASTINLMPLSIAEYLNLTIDRHVSSDLSMAKGTAKTSGIAHFDLTIGSITKSISALLLKDFQYTLLIGTKTCSRFKMVIDTENWSVKLKSSRPQANTNSALITTQTPSTSNVDTTINEIDAILADYDKLFAKSATDLGRITIESHRILLKDNEPVAMRPYRQSFQDAQETSRQIKDLLEKGLIRESVSPYAASVTLAPKKDGKRRLCLDFRRPNKKTIADKQPLPYIPDVIDRLQGSRFFSKLDFASGYWQVSMHPDDIQKTGFVTQEGHYEWLVLPFGLKNAPATFQRVVRKILGELINNGVLSYLDDIVIYAKTLDEHNRLLREVLKRLSDADVRLKREKCEFALNTVEFLGHIIGDDQVRPPPSKVKAILDFLAPKDVKEIQRFHGLANYLREYIKDFSTIMEPITRLNKKDIPFVWGEEQGKAFNKLKQLMADEPVRRIYNPKLPLELHTDASTLGLGAILIQNGHPIGYYSRKLNDAETRYTPTELECLAVVDAIKYFQIYLEGNQFKVVTDHSALQWLFNFQNTKRRLFHWSEHLSLFTFDVIHRPGKQMQHVDALSRAPVALLLSTDLILDAQRQSTDSFTSKAITTSAEGLKEIKNSWPQTDCHTQTLQTRCPERSS